MAGRNTWPLPVLGLTGSIASGKSEAGRVFSALGAEVIDADGLLRDVTRRGGPAHREIVRRFGRGVLNARGGIDRKKLAAEVFEDPGKRAALEAITHGRIMEAADARIRRIGSRRFVPVFIEAALLVETGLYRMLDGLVVVVCDRRLQVERLRESRDLGEDEIRRRIGAQMPWRAKARAADWIIENNADLRALGAAAGAVMARIRRSAPYRAKRKSWRPARRVTRGVGSACAAWPAGRDKRRRRAPRRGPGRHRRPSSRSWRACGERPSCSRRSAPRGR